MWLPSDLDILREPSRPVRIGIVSATCSSIPYARCTSRPSRRLNFWSVPPSSTPAGPPGPGVGADRDGVVGLHERIEQLEDRDRLLRRVALGEVVALEQLGNGR